MFIVQSQSNSHLSSIWIVFAQGLQQISSLMQGSFVIAFLELSLDSLESFLGGHGGRFLGFSRDVPHRVRFRFRWCVCPPKEFLLVIEGGKSGGGELVKGINLETSCSLQNRNSFNRRNIGENADNECT